MILLAGLLLTGSAGTGIATSTAEYTKISAWSQEIMEGGDPYVLLDVRHRKIRYGHIKEQFIDPVYRMKTCAEKRPVRATILVYCRSGRRSAIAAQALAAWDIPACWI
jgi:rhodanese-related sulfurtransferase